MAASFPLAVTVDRWRGQLTVDRAFSAVPHVAPEPTAAGGRPWIIDSFPDRREKGGIGSDPFPQDRFSSNPQPNTLKGWIERTTISCSMIS